MCGVIHAPSVTPGTGRMIGGAGEHIQVTATRGAESCAVVRQLRTRFEGKRAFRRGTVLARARLGMRALWCVLVSSLSFACGSKSDLLLGAPGAAGSAGMEGGGAGPVGAGAQPGGGSVGSPAGGGGGTGGGVVGAGGSVGVGGAAGVPGMGGFGGGLVDPDCGTMVLDGIRSVDAGESFLSQPTLVRTGPERVALLFDQEETSPPPISAHFLADLFFFAWGDWPDQEPLEGEGFSSIRLLNGFAAAGVDEYTYTFFAPGDEFLESAGTYFAPQWGLGAYELLNLGPELGRPLFIARGPGAERFIGYERGAGVGNQLVAGRVTRELIPETHSGCALDPIAADGLRTDDRYIVAFSTSREFSSCMDDDGIDGPAHDLEVGVWVDGQPAQRSARVDVGSSVIQVQTVAHGEWVSVLFSAESDENGEWVFVQRLDRTGEAPQGVVHPVTRMDDDSDRFAAAAWGGRYAVAKTMFNVTPPGITIELFDSPNELVASTAVIPNVDAGPRGAYSLLGSPDGSKLLVAWAGDTGPTNRIHVARLSCAP